MNTKIFYITLSLFLGSLFTTYSQASISPEIGVSILPFQVGWDPVATKDLLLGITIKVPVSDKWSIAARVSYTDREDVTWGRIRAPTSVDGHYIYTKYEQEDMNVDLYGVYVYRNRLILGSGVSMIRKLKSRYSEMWERITYEEEARKYIYGLNAKVAVRIYRMNIGVDYMRILYLDRFWNGFRNDKHRFSATISFPIIIGKKKG